MNNIIISDNIIIFYNTIIFDINNENNVAKVIIRNVIKKILLKREFQWRFMEKDNNWFGILKLNLSNLPNIVSLLIYLKIFMRLIYRELNQRNSVLHKESRSSHSSFDFL